MDVDHNDAFKLIEDVPNCLIWTHIARNLFGLFPNTEWNSLHRALYILAWKLLKRDIVEWLGSWWSIFNNHPLPWTILLKQNFFRLFSNAEWNTFSRALWIFVWNISKPNIVEFRELWWSICSNHAFSGLFCQNKISLGYFHMRSEILWAKRYGSSFETYQSSR